MAYIVQADGADGKTVGINAADDAKEALAAAIDLASQGCTNIRIISENRTLTMEELAAAIINDDY